MTAGNHQHTARGSVAAGTPAGVLAAFLAVVVPPLGVWLCRGKSAATVVSLALTAAAVATFLAFAAGPGLMLFGLACLHGAFVAPVLRGRAGPVVSLAALAAIASGMVVALAREAPPPADPAVLAHGARLAASCTACHRLAGATRPDDIGPSLEGMFGRRIGGLADYRYSEAMAASDEIWTVESLEAFLVNPMAFLPGTKMALGPMEPEQAAELVRYLHMLDGE